MPSAVTPTWIVAIDVARRTSMSVSARNRNACTCNANARCCGNRRRLWRKARINSSASSGTNTNIILGVAAATSIASMVFPLMRAVNPVPTAMGARGTTLLTKKYNALQTR